MYKKLISWSLDQHQHLPWRKKRTLYRTLVSEIMLQQTTVGTVLGKFEDFLKTFPNIKALALASDDEVTIAWKGLGYYRRARNLKGAAEIIYNDYAGKIPNNYAELISIKGIGAYTANAILAIGKDKKALAVDANLERVLSRLYGLSAEKGLKLQGEIQSLLEDKEFIKQTKNLSFRQFNEALMDLGRVYCVSRKARCLSCPMSEKCSAFQTGEVEKFPRVKQKIKDKKFLTLLRVLVRKENKLLVYKKNEKEWLSGQYEVPTFVLETDDKCFVQYPEWKNKINKIDEFKVFKTGITKYKIKNIIYSLDYAEFKKLKIGNKNYIFKNNNPEEENFSTSTMKLLKLS